MTKDTCHKFLMLAGEQSTSQSPWNNLLFKHCIAILICSAKSKLISNGLVQLHRNPFPPRCVMILHLNTKQSYPTDTPACIWIAFRRTSLTTTSPPPPPLPPLYKTRSPSHFLKVVDFVHPYWQRRVRVLAYSCAVHTTYMCVHFN